MKNKSKRNIKYLTKKDNNRLEKALKESYLIEEEYKNNKRSGYKNANEVLKSILDNYMNKD